MLTSDEELMVASDVNTAFAELMTHWWAPIVGYFFRRIRDYHLAEDLAIDAFVRVFKFRAGYSPDRAFKGWLFFQARMVLYRHYQSKRGRRVKQVQAELCIDTAVVSSDPVDSRMVAAERSEVLRRRLDDLPALHAEAIRRTLLGGESQVDIAAAEGVTPQAVSLRVQYGLKRLQRDREVMTLV